MKRTTLLMAGVAASGLLTAPAHAQDQAAAQAANAPVTSEATTAPAAVPDNDIIVTAQFRGQRLQQTPLAITALGANQLAEKGFTRITDITNTAPNVVLKPSGAVYGPAATLFIRGVGQTDSSFATEPGVGIYVDDVYRGITFGSLLDLLDLDRVEILRGPQGTLAGKNSIGGALKLFTRLPSAERDGYVEVTAGSYKRIDAKAASSFTLVPDRLYARVSAVTRHRDGYLRRLDYNCAVPGGPRAPIAGATADSGDCTIGREGGQDYTAGRAALRWIASDRIEVNLSADRLVDDSEPPATKLISFGANPATIPGFTGARFVTGPHDYTNYSTYAVQAFTDPATLLGRPGAGSHPAMTFPTHNRIRSWDAAGTIDIKLSDAIQIKSITAYQYTDGRYVSDTDVTPFGVSQVLFSMRYKQFTQELRVNGQFGKLVDWTAGGFYFDGRGFLGGTNIIYPGLPTETINVSDDRIPSISKSVFAHAVVHVTDRLNLTGGIRYTDDKKSYFFGRLNLYDPASPPYTSAALINGVSGGYKGDRVDYRANVDYRFTDTILGYAQVSTGYRGGGVNSRPLVVQQILPFGPETLRAYEVGLKTDLFDRKLRFNLAAFINDYSDIVFTNTAPTIINGVLISAANGTPVNAGDGRFKGVELETTLRLSRAFTIDGSLSYLDFKLRRLGATGATITGITLNSQAPYVTKWKWNVGAQYAADFGSFGTVTPRVDVSYQSHFFTAIDNFARTPAYTVVNGRLAWSPPNREWEAALTVTNMFNRFYYLNQFRSPSIVTISGQPGAPREIAFSVKRTF